MSMLPHFEIKAIEPMYQGRFILNFPKNFELDPYSVLKMSQLKYIYGIGWKDIIITLHDLVGADTTKKLIKDLEIKDLRTFLLEKLDPTGQCVEKVFIDSNFIEVDFGKFDYASDKLNSIILTIHPLRVIVE